MSSKAGPRESGLAVVGRAFPAGCARVFRRWPVARNSSDSRWRETGVVTGKQPPDRFLEGRQVRLVHATPAPSNLQFHAAKACPNRRASLSWAGVVPENASLPRLPSEAISPAVHQSHIRRYRSRPGPTMPWNPPTPAATLQAGEKAEAFIPPSLNHERDAEFLA